MTILHMLLALAANQDLELVQMDIKIAFLHGDLDEESIWNNKKVMMSQAKNTWYVNSRRTCMGLSSPQDCGAGSLMVL